MPNAVAKIRKDKLPPDPEPFEGTAATVAFIRGALLLQEKWAMMIVHSLMEGSISFNELMRRGNVNTTTLTHRLNLLVRAGVLVKTIHSTMPPRTSYELTESGRALKPVLDAITHWSETHLPAEPGDCPGDLTA